MTPYQISVIEYGWQGLAGAGAASAIQWWFSRGGTRRFWAGLHGVIFMAAFAYAVAVSPFSDTYPVPNYYDVPFLVLLLAGLLTALAGPFLRVSRPPIAILTSLVSLASGAYLALIGAMAIAHDWM